MAMFNSYVKLPEGNPILYILRMSIESFNFCRYHLFDPEEFINAVSLLQRYWRLPHHEEALARDRAHAEADRIGSRSCGVL